MATTGKVGMVGSGRYGACEYSLGIGWVPELVVPVDWDLAFEVLKAGMKPTLSRSWPVPTVHAFQVTPTDCICILHTLLPWVS